MRELNTVEIGFVSGGMQAQEGGNSAPAHHWYDFISDWVSSMFDSIFGGGGGGGSSPDYNQLVTTLAKTCENGVDQVSFVYGGNGSVHVEVQAGGVVEVVPVGGSGNVNVDNSTGKLELKCK